MIKTNIEAEGSELILKNKAGDYVIIPKKYRVEVQDMIKEGCHSCIDALVETLPISQDYAENGTVIINPDENPSKTTTKLKVENKKIYDSFTEDELNNFVKKDTSDISDRLKAQARYNYYSNLVENGEFNQDSTYAEFKKQLPSKLTDRYALADTFAQNNPNFYVKDEQVRQRLGEEAYAEYIQSKRQLEEENKTNTSGTDVFSAAHGARSIALNTEAMKIVIEKEKETDEKIRDAKYKVVYDPKTKDYEYILLDATKGSKYKLY